MKIKNSKIEFEFIKNNIIKFQNLTKLYWFFFHFDIIAHKLFISEFGEYILSEVEGCIHND